jgi:hypothetical protein
MGLNGFVCWGRVVGWNGHKAITYWKMWLKGQSPRSSQGNLRHWIMMNYGSIRTDLWTDKWVKLHMDSSRFTHALHPLHPDLSISFDLSASRSPNGESCSASSDLPTARALEQFPIGCKNMRKICPNCLRSEAAQMKKKVGFWWMWCNVACHPRFEWQNQGWLA